MVAQCQASLKAKYLQSVHELCCSMVLLCQQSPHFLHTEHKREVQTFSAQARVCVCVRVFLRGGCCSAKVCRGLLRSQSGPAGML